MLCSTSSLRTPPGTGTCSAVIKHVLLPLAGAGAGTGTGAETTQAWGRPGMLVQLYRNSGQSVHQLILKFNNKPNVLLTQKQPNNKKTCTAHVC